MRKSLKNRWIAITRPAHQAGKLIKKLEAEGANMIAFPLLEIIPPESPQLALQQIKQLPNCDIAVFISPNAVIKALSLVDTDILNALKIAAVGKKTALSLREQGVRVDYSPDKIFNSEALLALDALQTLENKRIVIFRGEGGRELLRDTFLQRGADVDYINVYARRCPVDHVRLLKQHYLQHKLDTIVLTSGESLSHLLRLASKEGDDWLNQIPLLLGSERIKQNFLANKQAYYRGKIWTAPDPSDESIYQALQLFL